MRWNPPPEIGRRLVDPSKREFCGSRVQIIPLDKVRRENIEDRTQDFS
jgi:hypothetical protein